MTYPRSMPTGYGYTPRLFLEADEYLERYLAEILLTDQQTGRPRELTINSRQHFLNYAASHGYDGTPILIRNGAPA